MATHDYVIANQGFPAFRSDLNDALAAIVSNNSSATEPTTMFAHMIWVDTAANPSVLKIRNADNDAWITVGVLDQTGDTFILRPAAGSATVPAYSTTSDTNTGVYFPGADRVGITTGGTQRVEIDASGNVGIGVTPADSFSFTKALDIGSAYGGFYYCRDTDATNGVGGIGYSGTDLYIANKAVGNIRFFCNTDASERMRIDSSGNLLVGTTTSPDANSILRFVKGTADVRWYDNTDGGIWTTFDDAKSIGLVSGVNYGQGSNNTVIKLSGGASGNVIVFANTNGVELVRNATSWSTFSDGRLKNITGTYENAIADILEIQPVKFTWKNDDSNKPCVGVIAQSVENVVPEAVSKSKNNINKEDETEYLSVRYTELIPLMIASIQELKAELDTVKAELVTLKGQ